MRTRRGLLMMGMLLTPLMVLEAQSPAVNDTRPRFAVTSVKVNTSGDAATTFDFFPGGRLSATNVSLRYVVRSAYLTQDGQIAGLPDWATSDRFDIAAKSEHDLAPTHPFGPLGPRQLILQTLLEDRFKFSVHTEKRELSVFALTIARSDGRLGPKIVKWDGECPDADAVLRGERRCGSNFSFGKGSVRVAARSPMPVFANALGFLVNRFVVDHTNLSGAYDIDLAWTSEQTADSSEPSIFTALQEQLGLKLESQRAPVDVLVIDRIERPAPD